MSQRTATFAPLPPGHSQTRSGVTWTHRSPGYYDDGPPEIREDAVPLEGT
eukprot:gene8090-7460_t